jgi:MoxR-like ATPase
MTPKTAVQEPNVTEKPFSLTNYVPNDADPEIVGYKPRKEYLAALSSYLDRKLSVLMIGEAGTGKTSLARYYSYSAKLPFLEVSCDSLLGFRELLGQVNITDGTSHFIEGLFTKFIQQPSVILLDEITALDPGKNFMLHQLLNSREFFIKEAERGKGQTYRLHPECRVILACNPPNAKYPGTNRLNVALVDRPQVIWVDDLTLAEVKQITPDTKHKDSLIRFYTDARSMIQKNSLRTTFSVRALKKISHAVAAGTNINDALHHGFLNGVRATAGDEGYRAVLGVASTIWPEVKVRF